MLLWLVVPMLVVFGVAVGRLLPHADRGVTDQEFLSLFGRPAGNVGLIRVADRAEDAASLAYYPQRDRS